MKGKSNSSCGKIVYSTRRSGDSMNEKRSLMLSATPMEPAELATVFSNSPASLRRKLEDPPKLRESGWGLATLDQAKLLHGELIRVETSQVAVDFTGMGT